MESLSKANAIANGFACLWNREESSVQNESRQRSRAGLATRLQSHRARAEIFGSRHGFGC